MLPDLVFRTPDLRVRCPTDFATRPSQLVRAITCTFNFIHCYAPNFKEVEGTNWFGTVRLSVHLPLLFPSPPPPPPPKKKNFFFRFEFIVKKFTYSKKLIFFRFGSLVKKKNSLTLAPPPPTPPPKKKIFFFRFGFLIKKTYLL